MRMCEAKKVFSSPGFCSLEWSKTPPTAFVRAKSPAAQKAKECRSHSLTQYTLLCSHHSVKVSEGLRYTEYRRLQMTFLGCCTTTLTAVRQMDAT